MVIVLGALLVFLTATGQLLLKRGAECEGNSVVMNRYVLAGYLIFFIVVIISYFLMYMMEMKNFTVIMSMSYVAVALVAYVVLKEKISMSRAFGTILICIGVIVFLMD